MKEKNHISPEHEALSEELAEKLANMSKKSPERVENALRKAVAKLAAAMRCQYSLEHFWHVAATFQELTCAACMSEFDFNYEWEERDPDTDELLYSSPTDTWTSATCIELSFSDSDTTALSIYILSEIMSCIAGDFSAFDIYMDGMDISCKFDK
jgi:hypothetical protein